mgnify:CR=1 FL=1
MTKKVGKDTIKKLIEEALDLSTPLKFTKKPSTATQYDDSVKDLKFKSNPVGLGAASGQKTRFMKALKALIDNDGVDTSLSSKDISDAKEDDDIKTALVIAQNTTSPELKSKIRALVKDTVGADKLTGYETGKVDKLGDERDIDIAATTTISFPNVMSTDASLEAGKFFGSQNDLINSIFSKGTIKERCEEFSKVSKSVFEDTVLEKEKDLRKNIQYAMFVDLCNAYFNLVDSRGVGYTFEAFCALLVGGTVVGGGNGAADFVTNDGAPGSSKKYSSYGVSSIKQSTAGFSTTDAEKSKVLHYVIAVPEYVKLNEEDERQGADKRVSKINLHYVIVQLLKEEEVTDSKRLKSKLGTFVTIGPNNNVLSKQVLPMKGGTKGQVKVVEGSTPADTFVGSVEIYSGQNSFKDVLNDQTRGKEDKFSKSYTAIKDFFTEMKKADEESKKYVNLSSPEPNDIINQGNAALNSIAKADSLLETLIKLLHPTKEDPETVSIDTDSQGQRSINEEKITSNFLKKLIEESFKK